MRHLLLFFLFLIYTVVVEVELETAETTTSTNSALPVTTTVADITNIDDARSEQQTEQVSTKSDLLHPPVSPNLEKYTPGTFETSKRSEISSNTNNEEDGNEEEENDGGEESKQIDEEDEEEEDKKPKHATKEEVGVGSKAAKLYERLMKEKTKIMKSKKKCHRKCELPMSYKECAIPRCSYKRGAIKRLCFLLCHRQEKHCKTVCDGEE